MRVNVVVLLLVLLPAAAGSADTPIERFVDDGTLLVAAVDVAAVEGRDGPVPLLEAGLAAFGSDGDADKALKDALGLLEQAGELGVRRAWACVAIDDLRPGFGPLVVLSFQDDAPLDRAEAYFSDRLELPTKRLESDGLAIASERTLTRYDTLTPEDRGDLLGPLEASLDSGEVVIAVLSPGRDARRVIRELWPTLDGPLRDLTGDLVARGVERVEFAVTAGESPAGSLRLVAASDAAAKRLEPLVAAAKAMGVDAINSKMPDLAVFTNTLAQYFRPIRDGATLSVTLSASGSAVQQFLQQIVTPVVQAARGNAQQNLKLNRAKQIGLSFHNFADVSSRESFPANAAIIDKEGQPLLSWRVAVLPFLEEIELYREFHLDEPWDSEHNLRVAKRMPEVFANPSHPELTERGLTTWLRPVYPGSDLGSKRDDAEAEEVRSSGRTFFYAPGDKLEQYTDGLSNIILFAEVAPEDAVFWTRPDDWRVDLDDPLAKLRTESRPGFVCGYADGHTRHDTFDIDPGLLKKLITKDGREVIDR